MFRFLLTVTSLALAVTLAFAPSAHAKRGKGTAIVLNLHGTGQAYPGTVPDIDGDGEDEPADCFDVDLINLETGKVVGGGTDCLANVNPGVNGGLEVVGTTYFHLPEGTLISRGLTTVQPVNHGSPGYTHITGAMPSGGSDIIGGTGAFAGASGTVRLSGSVDMSNVGNGEIFFDCIFVVELD